MSKTDLTQYSENELSLYVFNDEGLYRMRRNPHFIGYLRDIYNFTEEQLKVLEQDLEDDAKEF